MLRALSICLFVLASTCAAQRPFGLPYGGRHAHLHRAPVRGLRIGPISALPRPVTAHPAGRIYAGLRDRVAPQAIIYGPSIAPAPSSYLAAPSSYLAASAIARTPSLYPATIETTSRRFDTISPVEQAAVEMAVEQESELGLECCQNMDFAPCAACNQGITIAEWCQQPGNELRNGCRNTFMSNPKCEGGVLSKDGTACCDARACDGTCGGKSCRKRLGGPAHCCASEIRMMGESCNSNRPPCVIGEGFTLGFRNFDGGDDDREVEEVLSFAPGAQAVLVAEEVANMDYGVYDDGTPIRATGTGCGHHLDCFGCSMAVHGCTWNGAECVPYYGESECLPDLDFGHGFEFRP